MEGFFVFQKEVIHKEFVNDFFLRSHFLRHYPSKCVNRKSEV